MADLTPKQQLFVDEYLVDLNATQAAIRAGYSSKTAYAIADRLLRKAEVQHAIQEAKKSRSERTEITQDRVLKELARIAFFDPRKMFDADGKPIHISALDDETAAAVAGLEVVTKGNADMGLGEILKYKISDKNSALDKLCRHLGLYADKLALTGKDGAPLISGISVSFVKPNAGKD